MPSIVSSPPRRQHDKSPIDYKTDPETGAVLVPLRTSDGKELHALIDADDLDMVRQYLWRAYSRETKGDRTYFYVMTRDPNPPHGSVYMHRLIMGVSDRAIHIDHINHNPLDNRRENLRVVNHQQNIFNRRPNRNSTSPFKGVAWWSAQSRWVATIRLDGRRKHLGYFRDEIDAARVYDEAARELFGEHAYLNFPGGEECDE